MQAWEPTLCRHGSEPDWDRSCLQPAFTGREEAEKGERTVSLLSLNLWDTSFPSPALNLSQTPVREGSITAAALMPPQTRHCPSASTAPGRFQKQLQSKDVFSISRGRMLLHGQIKNKCVIGLGQE